MEYERAFSHRTERERERERESEREREREREMRELESGILESIQSQD